MKKIFISHGSDDNNVSKKIAQCLRNDGAEIWIHYADLEVNGGLPKGIEQAIVCCDAFVLILSKRTIYSECVDLEYQTALKLNKKIIPCLFADTKQKFMISNFECINFYNFEEGYENLLISLNFKEREVDINTESTNHILNFEESGVDISPEPANHALNFKESEVEIITESTHHEQISQPVLISPVFRYQPKKLSENDVNEMLKINNFFEKNRNKQGRGFNSQFELYKIGGNKIIVDHNSGLIWLPDGSPEAMVFSKAKTWIEELNQIKYAHYDDWRMPTLEELMSLMTKEHENGELFINAIFDQTQKFVWTSDLTQNESLAWVVFFNYGSCYVNCFDLRNYVRAVRSEKMA